MGGNRFSCAAKSLAGVLAAATLQPALPPAPVVALTGARVSDGTGGAPIEADALLVACGRIEAIGAAADVAAPDGATRVDVAGKTTIHTLGDDGVESVRVRDRQARGEQLDRARLFVSGPNVVAETAEDARRSIDRVVDMRVNIIKNRLNARPDDMTPAVYRALIDQAQQRELRVVAHLIDLDDAKGLLGAGVDVGAHNVRNQGAGEELIAELIRFDVGYIQTPTHCLSVFLYETTPAFFEDPFYLRGGDAFQANMEENRDAATHKRVRASEQAQITKRMLEQARRNLKLLSDGGVTIAMGTDSGRSLGRWQGYT